MSAGSRFFVDANVLLYAADPADKVKQREARVWLQALWESGAGTLSWQVLHEFYASAVKKLGTAPRQARQTVAVFAQWSHVETTLPVIERAWHWMDEAQLSYWDALILAAAERTSSNVLLSEDFQAGRIFGEVEVVNPFRRSPGEFDFPTHRAN